jgi:drug/metabolite transporter (DMT)-like permease
LHGRSLIEVGVTFSFLTSILILPLTDVYTILLTAPLLISMSGVLLFKKSVGLPEWLAVIISFLGVLIVV